MTTAAPPTNGQPVSLLELGAGKVAGLAARRRAKRAARSGRGVWTAVGELAGTVAALACFTIAAFAAGFIVGMAVAGVALLLLDFKVTVVRRARAAGPQRR